jgi:hypothetical protein
MTPIIQRLISKYMWELFTLDECSIDADDLLTLTKKYPKYVKRETTPEYIIKAIKQNEVYILEILFSFINFSPENENDDPVLIAIKYNKKDVIDFFIKKNCTFSQFHLNVAIKFKNSDIASKILDMLDPSIISKCAILESVWKSQDYPDTWRECKKRKTRY